MFDRLRKLIPKRFLVTSAKRVPGNGRNVQTKVWAMSPAGAAMEAEPAGRSKIVKVQPLSTEENPDTGKYTVIYAAIDANNISYIVTVEEL